MDPVDLKKLVEAALLAHGQPLNMEQLRCLFDEFERPEPEAMRVALQALAGDCAGRPL